MRKSLESILFNDFKVNFYWQLGEKISPLQF